MTPHEKALQAVNVRLELLQSELRQASLETAQRFLFQSIVITVAAAEALNDYVKVLGQYAQDRHAEVKRSTESLTAQHSELLGEGQVLLERWKANPTDQGARKQLEAAQRNMAALQKSLRRAANSLQRELAPGLAMIDALATSLRRFVEAEKPDVLKRVAKGVIEHVHELYAAQDAVRGKGIVDVAAWESAALAEIDGAAGFWDAFARTGYQLTLALELMSLALLVPPPQDALQATQRANDAVAARVKEITVRFTSS